MTKLANAVRDYWSNVSSLISLDAEVLQNAIDTLEESEQEALIGRKRDAREFMMHKVFNRYTDICNGHTAIEDGDVCITTQSSITELDISLTTLLDCNKNAIYKIEDLAKEVLPSLQYDSIAEAREALERYAQE